MSENKTKPTTVNPVDFINQSDPKKIEGSLQLVKLMEKLSGEKAVMWGPSIIGFGKCSYKTAAGREGIMPLIGFSPRKDNYTLYIISHKDFSEELWSSLGKYKRSKACIYFKKLADINMDVLEKMIIFSLDTTKEKYF